MADGRYNVVFRGEVLDYFTPEQVKKSLAQRYRRSESAFDVLFTGEPYVLARQLEWKDAERVLRLFEELGAVVYIEEVGAPGQPAEVREVAEAQEGAEASAPGSSRRTLRAAAPLLEAPEIASDAPAEDTGRAGLFRYRFDTFMARGGTSIFKVLVLVFVGIFVAIGATRGLLQWLVPETALQHAELDFWGNLYITFLQLTDPGNMAQDIRSAPSYKVFSVLAGLSGVIMLSALIAFITTSLDQKLSELKRGRSKVIEEGHTLILGWNEQRIVEIIRELVIANESEDDACVVVLADKDKEEMDDILRLRLPDTQTTRLVTRSGSVSTIANLDMVSIETCKSAIILAQCEDTDGAAGKAASDAMVIQTILASTGKASRHEDFCVVAEIYNPTHREIVETTFGEDVVTIDTSDILAKLLVQTSRSVGLSVVYNEILSFDGCEMYFYGADWGDVDFAQIAYHFPDGVPMGVRQPDGAILLNPPGDYRMEGRDEILIVAEDDSTIEYLPEPVARPGDLSLAGERLSQEIERELILGWNHKAPIILREFADYVSPGSQVHVLLGAASDAERQEIETVDAELETVEVRLFERDRLSREALLELRPFEYDNIIILAGGGEGVRDANQIDSENIVTLLLLRSIFAQHPDESRETKLITEVLDSQNHSLVARAGVKDIIISNRLVSMIMAQVSESRHIKKVYDDIFQEDGSEIYLKPAALYLERFPADVSFADLMGVARQRDEVCIGVKIRALEADSGQNCGVRLIPEKNTRFSLTQDDCLIVLAEDEL